MKKGFVILLILNIIICTFAGFLLFCKKYHREIYFKGIVNMHHFEMLIIDDQPESFKNYILNHNTEELIINLKKGLDKESIENIDNALYKIINMPDRKYSKYFYIYKNKYENHYRKYFNDKKFSDDKIDFFSKEFPKIKDKYKLSNERYSMPIFIYHHGLRFANDKIKEYIKGKTFIDMGAFIGDSAIVMAEYKPSKIYSFDVFDEIIDLYKKTMQMNNIPENLYEINKIALSNKKGKYEINFDDEFAKQNKEKYINSIDLDSFLEDKNIKTGFIKGAVEGDMYKVLQGMKKTIRKDRPVLSLVIDHSPEEFFLTKPLLDEYTKDLNYKISIKTDRYGISPYKLKGLEIFAYPKELDD